MSIPLPTSSAVWNRAWCCGLVLTLLVALACGKAPRSSTTSSPSPPRYVDLLRAIEGAGLHHEENVGIEVWSLDGDSRATLFLHPPNRLEVGPFTLDGRCTLRFGVGLREAQWSESDGVDFEVRLLRDGSGVSLFSESLIPAQTPTPRWLDRQIEIPNRPGRAFSLQFIVGPGPQGDHAFDHAGLSNLHLRCSTAGEPAPTTTPADDRPPVILISIDTLRWDHLGLYGYHRPTSPVLDALAEQAVVFDTCFAPSPYTLPSHATLLTGLAPVQHRAGFEHPQAPLAPDALTLAERLSKHGYRTVALTAGGLVSRQFGLDRGFDDWRELQRANLRSVLPAVFDLIGSAPSSNPLFLFLHTYDVHGPYQQPQEHRYFSADDDAVEPEPTEETWQQVVAAQYHQYQELERFRSPAEVVAAYDSGIRFVDSQLGHLFDYLRELELFDRAVIVVTSDHGESLFEKDRYFGHSHTLEDREVRVPLLVRFPGAVDPGRMTGLAELGDVVPMVLSLAGLDARDLPGVDHTKQMNERGGRRPWVSGGSSHLGAVYVRSGDWKLISPPHEHWTRRLEHRFGAAASQFETGWQLYEVGGPHPEEDNRYGDAAGVATEVRRIMRSLREIEVPGRRIDEPEPDLDAGTRQRLRALGYLQ